MIQEECTRVACFLAEQGGLVSIPLVTVAGLVDGINPCAIGMMVMLLGYLMVFAKKPGRILITGLVYIISVFITYLVVGLGFYSIVSRFDFTGEARVLNVVVGAILMGAGIIQIKDFLGFEWGPHLRIPTASKARLLTLIEKVTIPATILLGVLVTLLETPCSLPLYVGTATILAQSGMAMPFVVMYFLYYNFLFVLPLIVVLLVVYRGKKLVDVKEWEHKAKRWMHLSLGLVLSVMGLWLLLI